MTDDAIALLGVWRLEKFALHNVDTAATLEPYGARPNGALILHPGGRMIALITPGEQARPTSEAAEAEAFRRMIAYSGRYRLEPPDSFVTDVDIAWFQPWLGTQQVRRYRLDGDRLDIVSAPARTPLAGGTATGVLSWRRE